MGNLSGSRTIRNLNRLALEWGVKEAWLEMTTLGFEDWTLGNVATWKIRENSLGWLRSLIQYNCSLHVWGPGFKPREKPLDSQSRLTKAKNWEDRAGSLLPVGSVQKRGDEELGRWTGRSYYRYRYPGAGTTMPAAACRCQSKDLKDTRNWEVPDGSTQEIMSQG